MRKVKRLNTNIKDMEICSEAVYFATFIHSAQMQHARRKRPWCPLEWRKAMLTSPSLHALPQSPQAPSVKWTSTLEDEGTPFALTSPASWAPGSRPLDSVVSSVPNLPSAHLSKTKTSNSPLKIFGTFHYCPCSCFLQYHS